jgi:hypothetical protein
MASNPYAQFKKPNPYAVYSTQGAGPKAPTGYAAPGAAAVAAVPGGPEDIHTISRQSSARSGAEQAARIAAERQILAIQQGTPIAQANLAKAQAEAVIARQKADESKAEQAIATMTPDSNVHGEAYLKQFVPPAMQAVVKAYARGDLGSRSGGMSTSMLPIIQHAMNYDPSTSGVNFPARVKMQSDLASGDPKSAGGSLQAFERMLLHGGEVLDAGGKLNNFRSGVPAILNYPKAGIESVFQDRDLAHFNAMVRNYAPEAQKAVSGVAGGEAERQERANSFAGSMSPQALVGGLQADARQAFDAMQATNDRYKRIMGHDILDAMSPQAKAAYDKIMAGGFDKAGKPLLPADGWAPISGQGGGQAGGGDGHDPNNPYGPASQQGVPMGLATGKSREVPDPQANALLDGLLRSGASDEQINAALKAVGHEPVNPTQTAAARAYMAKHPDYKGGFGAATKTENQTLWNRATASPLGVGVGSAADAGLAGFTDEIGAGIGALTGQGKYSDLLDNLNAKKESAFATNPRAHFLGTLAGTATGAAGLESGLGSVASKLGEYGLERGLGTVGARAAFRSGRALSSPVAADALYGGLYGAGEGNDDRTGGAILGATFGAGGGMFGRSVARGASNAVRGVKDEAVRYLNDAGVPLTVGQVLGGFSKKFENSFSSVNPQIAERYIEGMQGFNKAGFDQGLDVIGAKVGQTGAQGVADARNAVSGVYRNTLDPLSFHVDPQFGADYTNTALRGAELPRTMARNAQDTLRMRIQDNVGPDGIMNGNDFQQSLRGLRQDSASFLKNDTPYATDFDAVSRQGQDALRGMVNRQAPGALDAFDAANAANRNVSVLKDAVHRARNGTRTGETDLFAPSQLSDAAAANARRYGGTEGTPDQPFFDLTRAGQKVLPNTVPDSGTAPRMLYALGAHSALNGLTAGAGAGVGFLGGNTKEGTEVGTGAGLTMGALLALGGTKTGQRVLTKMLLDRPDWAEPVADRILRSAPRAGMMFSGFGSALNPALVPAR